MPNNGLKVNSGASLSCVNASVSAIFRAASGVTPPAITATAVSSGTINVSLSSVGTGAEPLTLERSLDGSNWTVVSASLTSASFPYSDTGRSASTLYYYRLKATDSDYSSTVSATTSAASGSLSGGTAALGWSLTEDAEGATLSVTTDGTHSFGNTGPTIAYFNTLADIAHGDPLTTSKIDGDSTVEINVYGGPIVHDVPGLPYGKGMVVGTEDSYSTSPNSVAYRQLRIVDAAQTDEVFEFMYVYMPEATRAAIDALLGSSSTWQFKSWWHFNSSNGDSDTSDPDFFWAGPAWYGSGGYWNDAQISGNGSVSSNDPSGMLTGPKGSGTSWRTNPLCRVAWAKAGPTLDSAVGSNGFYRLVDTVAGLARSDSYVDRYKWAGWNANSTATDTTIGWDRGHLPGYVRGFNRPDGYHFYYAMPYKASGPGACARIEITDNADYEASTRPTICTDYVWADFEVVGTVRKGIFHGESLIGKHIHVFDASNTHTYVGQIGA